MKRTRGYSKKSRVSKRARSAVLAHVRSAFGSRRRRSGFYKRSAVRLNTHSFIRYASTKTITLAAGTAGIGGAYTFKMDDIINKAEFTALFDQYKITRVELIFKLHSNPYEWADIQYTGSAMQYAPITWPTIYLCNDHDDDNTPTLSELKERPRTKRFILRPNNFLRWSCRPTVLNQLYRTVATTGYAPKWNQYIDVANTDVPHYATKYFIDYDGFTLPAISANAGANVTVNVELRYHFTCKDVR